MRSYFKAAGSSRKHKRFVEKHEDDCSQAQQKYDETKTKTKHEEEEYQT